MTSDHVRGLLRDRYCKKFGQGGEFAFFTEVQSGVGGRRYADVIAMSLFPSRGLSIHGHEIKVSRSDWLRELKNAAKAEDLVRHCDYWWVVAPQGIVADDELPEGWGLMEVTKNGRGLKAKVKAPKLERDGPVDRAFVAALLRRSVEQVEMAQRDVRDQAYREARETARESVERELEMAHADYDRLAEAVVAFQKETGIDIVRGVYVPGAGQPAGQELGRVVKLVLAGEHEVDVIENRLERLREQATSIVESIDRQLEAAPTEFPMAL